MKQITLIQSSLRKQSNTAIVCDYVAKKLISKNTTVNVIDLRNISLQFCDGRPVDEYNSDMQEAIRIIESSDTILIGMPVYNFTMSGVLKNFIDIVMYAFSDKNFGVLINAGGPNSFMAGRDIMDSIFYQVGATPLYPHVYTHAMHFEDGVLTDQKAISKIDELIEKII